MEYCSKCGRKLEKGSIFCSGCGSPVVQSYENPSERKKVYEGTVHKCPHCGETIPSFSSVCPSCGHEFRDVKNSEAVKRFEEQLTEIESKRNKSNSFTGIAESVGLTKKNRTDEQKINLVSSYIIPNTKEDILEFMILATSNINESIYKNIHSAQDNSPEKRLSDAWMMKAEQAYNKAMVMFGNDPVFYNIKEIYDRKMNSVKSAQRNAWIFCLALIGGLFLFVLLGMALT